MQYHNDETRETARDNRSSSRDTSRDRRDRCGSRERQDSRERSDSKRKYDIYKDKRREASPSPLSQEKHRSTSATIAGKNFTGDPLYISAYIEKRKINTMIDGGSAISLISDSLYYDLAPNTLLEQSKLKLQTVTL